MCATTPTNDASMSVPLCVLATGAFRGRRCGAVPSPSRLGLIRQQLAAGTYLAERAEEKLAAVVNGLLAELADGPQARSHRVAG